MQRVVLILTALGVSLAQAQEPNPRPEPSPAAVQKTSTTVAPNFSEPPPALMGGTEPTLSVQESAGVSLTQQWADKSLAAMSPQPGPDGSVQFRYGESLPTIVCALLTVTDLELQPGETIIDHGLQCGDNRWNVDTAKNPNDPDAPQHVYVKPTDVGLKTSLVITTDRRTYCLRLISTGERYMHRVTFVYPSAGPVSSSRPPAAPEPQPTPKKVKVALEDPVPRRSTRVEREGKGEVPTPRREDDGYRISGRAPWKPQRVYNDGKQTFIELPSDVSSKEAPALFVLRKGGFLGLGAQKQVINSRLHGRWIVADQVIDKAELVVGVGPSKDRVTICREKKGGADED